MPPLAAAETPGPFAFNESFDNWGMVVAGVLVTVLWLLFRKMLELSEKKQAGPQDKE